MFYRVLTFTYIFIVLSPNPGTALQVKAITSLNIVVGTVTGAKLRKFSLDQIKADKTLTQIDPHLFMNPEHKIAKWSGFELRKILKDVLNPRENRTVVATGLDGYSAEYNEQILSEHAVIVATEKDGVKLTAKEGSAQIAFPIADAKLAEIYKGEAYWVWYLSTIFIGEPAPVLAIHDSQGARDLELTKLASKQLKKKRIPCFPAGKRITQEPRQPAELSYVPLLDLVKAGPNQKIIIGTYLGTETEVTGDASQYGVAFASNGSRIPPLIGGPIELVHETRAGQCLYFVNSVTVKP